LVKPNRQRNWVGIFGQAFGGTGGVYGFAWKVVDFGQGQRHDREIVEAGQAGATKAGAGVAHGLVATEDLGVVKGGWHARASL